MDIGTGVPTSDRSIPSAEHAPGMGISWQSVTPSRDDTQEISTFKKKRKEVEE